MIHIHPFPARMAPEIALNKLKDYKKGQVVLDPMSGSGMVLNIASRSNISSIGVDLDPLARLISEVGSTKIDPKKARSALAKLLEFAQQNISSEMRLPWIDDDVETSKFIEYWFADKQRSQLRALSYGLLCADIVKNRKLNNLLKVALSRLIITKEPKASLARDTAHSRPHRTIIENSFDVFEELSKSLEHVIRALSVEEIHTDSKLYLGDARKISMIKSEQIDAIVTSPPYLNAIDYIRGHKFSLVWFGHSIPSLREVRGSSIGSERSSGYKERDEFNKLYSDLELDQVEPRTVGILHRYFSDLCMQLSESSRVLKKSGMASYVIGNSAIKEKIIRNDLLVKRAAALAGLRWVEETVRDIPDNRRYLPISIDGNKALSKRMRTEHIITFTK